MGAMNCADSSNRFADKHDPEGIIDY